jgi:DNA-binding response OmpR family regulator
MKILIIEDEPEIADDIKQYFMSNGIQCEKAKNYREAIERINMYSYDCILLDLKLPDGEGFEILKELKTLQKEEGIIIVSAQEALESRIKGLNLGADDYVTKPFHISELFARTLSVIRRKKFLGYNVVSFNEITIDIFDKSVRVNSTLLDMTKTEIELLLYLIANQNRVLSKSAIAEYLSGDLADMLDSYDFVYTHIKNLKKKIALAGGGEYIKTVYGTGYKWQDG